MLKLQHLTKRYGQYVGIADLSFEVQRGEIFALVGPNGSGKTTTLKCIAGLAFPDSGSIQIAGHEVSREASEVKRFFSYLPQHVSFPGDLTAREVAEFYCRLRKLSPDMVRHILRASDLNGVGDRPLRQYSGGMIQRLGTSLALATEVPLLLLDEPTGGLDPDAAARLRLNLAELRDRGTTVVFASHTLSEVETLADRIAVLIRGKVVAIDSTAALRARTMAVCQIRIASRTSRPDLCQLALRAGATKAEMVDSMLRVTSSSLTTLAVLHALELAGAQIEHFSTRDASLEEAYREYVHENSDCGCSSPDDKLSFGPASTSSN